MTRRMDIRVLLAKYENWIDDIITSVMFVLHDKEEFDEKRMKSFYEEWDKLWDAIKDEYVSCEDLKKHSKKSVILKLKK